MMPRRHSRKTKRSCDIKSKRIIEVRSDAWQITKRWPYRWPRRICCNHRRVRIRQRAVKKMCWWRRPSSLTIWFRIRWFPSRLRRRRHQSSLRRRNNNSLDSILQCVCQMIVNQKLPNVEGQRQRRMRRCQLILLAFQRSGVASVLSRRKEVVKEDQMIIDWLTWLSKT